MRRGISVATACFSILALGFIPAPKAESSPVSSQVYGRPSFSVDVGLFYDDLDPYGDWIDYEGYGYVYAPRVGPDWRPYTMGRWVWTIEYGWLWVSDEPFGWATYHYGRWMPSRFGWLWVPGYEWGPAWVSWRSGGGYVGWAPLPPRATWQVGIGFHSGGGGFDAYLSSRDYNFVPMTGFADYRYDRVVPVERNVTIINITQNITNYTTTSGPTTSERRVVNRGIDPERLRRDTGRDVQRVRVQEVSDTREARQARVRGDSVEVFRPQVAKKADRQPKPRRAIESREVERSPELAERANRHQQRQLEIETREREEKKKGRPEVAERERSRQEPEQPRPEVKQQPDRQRDLDRQREEQQQQRERQQAIDRQRNDQAREAREREQQRREEQRRTEADQRRADEQRRTEADERKAEADRKADKDRAEREKQQAEKQKADQKKKEQQKKQKPKDKEQEPPNRR